MPLSGRIYSRLIGQVAAGEVACAVFKPHEWEDCDCDPCRVHRFDIGGKVFAVISHHCNCSAQWGRGIVKDCVEELEEQCGKRLIRMEYLLDQLYQYLKLRGCPVKAYEIPQEFYAHHSSRSSWVSVENIRRWIRANATRKLICDVCGSRITRGKWIEFYDGWCFRKDSNKLQKRLFNTWAECGGGEIPEKLCCSEECCETFAGQLIKAFKTRAKELQQWQKAKDKLVEARKLVRERLQGVSRSPGKESKPVDSSRP